ncbi:phage baseplate assembly protein V [Chitiniphilus purpureus]|uniref:Phage baseplate assembly protein V n=1 Tax=Chitiniphilus purpureus TaxID=2981137 RepID=A0ABY6DR73_9NEIS|nr:phage baseplate assembly protein V [Chitiniphilus sp. CD1]UXY16728.1 phage baseplate assembly protein V [Chitiniphilus sp. CD1]
MNPTPDLARRLESLLRFGTIAQVDPGRARCTVTTGGITTEWLPWFALRAGRTQCWNPPTVGEQCLVLAPSGELAGGVVLLGMFSEASPAPSSDPDETLTVYPDGATLRYNHATHAMTIDGIASLVVNASDRITLRAGRELVLDTPQATSTNQHTIEGLLTYLAGLIGHGGSGGGSTITGPITQTGGALSSNGVVLDNHRHPESIGDMTGGPL